MPRRRWVSRLVLPGVLLAALVALLAFVAGESLAPTLDVEVVPVVTRAGAAVQAGTTTVQAPGWVEADPYAVTVAALAPGVVREVLVLEGEPVERDQVVATLVDDDARLALNRAEARLRERQSDVELMRAAVAAAETNWANPYEHERVVAVAQANLAARQAGLEKLDRELDVERAKLHELEDEVQRVERAFEREVISEARLTQLRLQREAQAAMVESLAAERPVREAAAREAEATLHAAEGAYRLRVDQTRERDQARAALARAEAQRDLAATERDEAQLRFDRMQVRSPVAGVVMRRLVEPGATITGTPGESGVVRVYNPEKLQVRVDVPLADAAKIGVGTSARINVEVLPDREFTGRITRIVHEADIQKNTLEVKVAIEDPTAALKPEMLARVRFIADSTASDSISAVPGASQRLFLPEVLVQREGEQAYVWVVNQDGRRAERRAITLTGGRDGRWVETSSGLRPGDRIIASAPADMRDGARLSIIGEARSITGARGEL